MTEASPVEASPTAEVPVVCLPQLRQWSRQKAPLPIFIFLALCRSPKAACRRCLRALKGRETEDGRRA